MESETIRRQEAEKQMLLLVQATGQATRTGVTADLRKAPISVSVNGAAGTAVNQSKMDRIATLVAEGRQVRQAAPRKGTSEATIPEWTALVNDWWGRTDKFFAESCTPQARVIASDLSPVLPMSWGDLNGDGRVQGTYSNVDKILANLTELLKRPELCP